MFGSASANTPLVSEFADDPTMSEIIAEFIAELPDRIESIRAAMKRGDTPAVRRFAHQLKGAGGGYGYPIISQSAALAERRLAPRGGLDPDVAHATSELESMLGYCHRASLCGPKEARRIA